MILCGCILSPSVANAAVGTGVGSSTTNRGDDARTGWYSSPIAPLPDRVAQGFGRTFTTSLGGQVYVQPIVAKGNLIVATETDVVAGLGPATGSVRWQRTIGEPVDWATDGCHDLTPWRGVTSTPVFDPATGSVFVMAEEMSRTGIAFRLHSIDPIDGAERPGFPVRISGQATNVADTSFEAGSQLQRPGLLLLGGVVYAGFGSHCDQRPYNGWVAGISTSGRLTTLWAAEPNSVGDGGIWQSGAGLSSDGPGQILLSSGNGQGRPSGTPGQSPGSKMGDAIVRLALQPDGSLRTVDFFSPYEHDYLNDVDADLGTSGVVVLPSSMGSSETPKLAVTASKAGWLYLVDRTSLGGTGTGFRGSDQVVARIGLGGRITSTPTVSPVDKKLYVVTRSSVGLRRMVAVAVTNSRGKSGLEVVATSRPDFAFGSGPPTVTTRGDSPGTGVAWVVRCGLTPTPCADAALTAFKTAPTGDQLVELASWPIGAGTKFSQPLAWSKRIFIGTADGVIGFGRVTPDITVTSTFEPNGDTHGSGDTFDGSIHISSRTPTTVSSVAFSSPAYTADPAGLAAISSTPASEMDLSVAVDASSLAAAGESTSEVTVVTTAGSATIPISVRTTSDGPLLQESGGSLASFGGLGRTEVVDTAVTLTNIGLAPLTVTSLTPPSAPFVVEGDILGAVIPPGSSLGFHVQVSGSGVFGLTTSRLVVATDGGNLGMALVVTSRR